MERHGAFNGTFAVSLAGAVFIVFLTLRLLGLIGWSWWWVTSPLWVPVALIPACGLALVLAVVAVVLIWVGRKIGLSALVHAIHDSGIVS